MHWPRLSRPQGGGRSVDKYLSIDLPIQEGLRLNETRCDFWELILPLIDDRCGAGSHALD